MELEFLIRVERSRGEYMYEQLAEIFSATGISLEAVQRDGALCLDVQYGPEIEAFKRFGTPRVIACEPESIFGKDKDEPLKFVVQAALGEGVNLRVVRDGAITALKQLSQERPPLRVGVITDLNAHPEHGLDARRVAHVIDLSLPLVSAGGCVIVSARERLEYVIPEFEKAATKIGDIACCTILERVPGSAGRTFLVATSKESNQ